MCNNNYYVSFSTVIWNPVNTVQAYIIIISLNNNNKIKIKIKNNALECNVRQY